MAVVDSSVVIVGTVLVAACETTARSTAAQDSVALDRVTVDLAEANQPVARRRTRDRGRAVRRGVTTRGGTGAVRLRITLHYMEITYVQQKKNRTQRREFESSSRSQAKK